MRKIYASYCLNFLLNRMALCVGFNAEKSKGKGKTPIIYLCIHLMGNSPVINYMK